MVQSAKCWVGSVLISECSAKSKHERTYGKPDTPPSFLSSVLMEYKLPGAAMWMQRREKKNKLTAAFHLSKKVRPPFVALSEKSLACFS